VALCGSDCDIRDADYPLIGNDSARGSISYFVRAIIEAYHEGRAQFRAQAKEQQKQAEEKAQSEES
jgi:ribosomal protein S2